jgi:Protein of unknown function (DUF4058)
MPQFPGMNPYLEGYLFKDLHNALASRIRAQLTPLLRPKYAARLEISVVQDDNPGELNIIYPDVEVIRTSSSASSFQQLAPAYTPSTLTLPAPTSIRVPRIEVKEAKTNILVTCIEILSYVNKRHPGLRQYIQKRERLIRDGVHLVEIDLLRRGTQPIDPPLLPDSHYRVITTRIQERVDVWAVQMQDPLPTIPIPLLPPDADVPLDLNLAIHQVYEEADYDLSIDYSKQPPPPLSDADKQWLELVIHRDS